jgi:hypothetical protein
MRVTATQVLLATGACLACSLELGSGAHFVVTSDLPALDQKADVDSLNWFRMALRLLSVMVVVVSALRYMYIHTSISQKSSGPSCGGRGTMFCQTTSAKKKRSLSDDDFDSEDDRLSTEVGSTATSDDEFEDAPSYSRTILMNYRAYCLESPTSSALSATISGLQGLTTKDTRSSRTSPSSKSMRESNDDSRWASLRSSPGPRNQVKRLEMPPGLELPDTSSNSWTSDDIWSSDRPWRTQAKADSTTLLSSALVNPISSGLRPQKKF